MVSQPAGNHSEMPRLLAAAVVNRQFRQTLLNDPMQALEVGCQGEMFTLTRDERALLLSIQANSLPDLARQLVSALEFGSHSRRQHTLDVKRTFTTTQ